MCLSLPLREPTLERKLADRALGWACRRRCSTQCPAPPTSRCRRSVRRSRLAHTNTSHASLLDAICSLLGFWRRSKRGRSSGGCRCVAAVHGPSPCVCCSVWFAWALSREARSATKIQEQARCKHPKHLYMNTSVNCTRHYATDHGRGTCYPTVRRVWQTQLRAIIHYERIPVRKFKVLVT